MGSGDCGANASCSVHRAIDLVGGKWKLFIIRVLLTEGASRFNELLREVEPISPKVLTENLRELEESNLVERVGQHRAYAMTESGGRLFPVLHSLGQWVESHDALVTEAQVG